MEFLKLLRDIAGFVVDVFLPIELCFVLAVVLHVILTAFDIDPLGDVVSWCIVVFVLGPVIRLPFAIRDLRRRRARERPPMRPESSLFDSNAK